MKVEVNRQWVQRRGCQHDLSPTFYHPSGAKLKTVRLYLETAPRMKHLFPSLAAALLSLAHEGRGQVFRLPNASACQKSKRRSKKFWLKPQRPVTSQSNSQIQTKLLNFPGIVHESRFGKSYHFSWLAAGRDAKMDWEGARNYCRCCIDYILGCILSDIFVKGVLYGLHQHRDQGWERLGEARAEGGGRALHLDRGEEVQL